MKVNSIKVALVNNMNNNFFSFARYLRDNGINAHLYTNPDTPQHFSPVSDTFEDIQTLDWIQKFPYGDKNIDWIFARSKTLNKIFNTYDMIISCGLNSAYLQRAGIRSDIIIPYGSDLYDLPFREIKYVPNIDFVRSLLHSHQAYYQRKAYQDARCLIIEASSTHYSIPLKRLSINWINKVMPMLYNLANVDNQNINNYIPTDIINNLNNSEFIVFNHSRQLWSSNIHNLHDFDKYLGIKRNDKVIKAFAYFTKITRLKNPLLILFEYGQDLEDSKKLIDELKIKDHVIWIQKSPRKVILLLLKKYATFGTGQFRERISAGFGGVSYEILSSGVPLLTHMASTDFFMSSPAIEALIEDDILNIFKDYETNPHKYKEIGEQSKKWFDENLGLDLAKKYVKLIEMMVKDKSLTQNDEVVREIFER